MFSLAEFKIEAKRFAIDVDASGDDIILSKGKKPLVAVKCVNGVYSFVAMKDVERMGIAAGQSMIPSDQDNIPAHAATCARDM